MIKLITQISIILYLIAFFPSLFITIFLTLKLWGNKYILINKIAQKAPSKFRNRAKFLMEANASWVFASSANRTIWGYYILRFCWKIPKAEIKQWYKDIEYIFGPLYKYYRLNYWLITIWLPVIPVMILFIYLHKA